MMSSNNNLILLKRISIKDIPVGLLWNNPLGLNSLPKQIKSNLPPQHSTTPVVGRRQIFIQGEQ